MNQSMLALVGSGEYLPPMEAVDRDLISRLNQPARVVCLPTAAGTEGEERIGYWSHLGVEHFTRLDAQVQALPVTDRASANDPGLAKEIAAANFVYLSGGKPDYLYRTLAGSQAWDAIQSVLAGGGLLAGCSAGAMVMGEKFFGLPDVHAGFNLIPGAFIVPHYDEIPGSLSRLMGSLAGRKRVMFGIEAYTALVKMGNHFEVIGSGGVTVWNKAGKIRHTQGALPDWH
jgi:cyanophycinase